MNNCKMRRVLWMIVLLVVCITYSVTGLSFDGSMGAEHIRIEPQKQGIKVTVDLPEGSDFTRANMEYWNGRIFEEGEKIRTNRSYSIKKGQKRLEFVIKDDPRIELNKNYMNFIIYFRLRFQDKHGELYDTEDMVYYVQRVWHIKAAGSMTFFAQRKNAYWDKLPDIAKTITETVDDVYGLKQKKVFVLLYKNSYTMSYDTGMPGWAAALFWWNIWIRDYNNETRFIAELAHEYTHYLQYENESKIPLFFKEGMSDYIYYLLAPEERPDLSYFHTLMVEDKYIPADKMFAGYPEENKYINSFYKQSYLFVNYVAEKLGPEKFKSFIKRLSDKSLEQVIAETPEFSKKRIYGMWMEIDDQIKSVKPRSLFKDKEGSYPPPVQQVRQGWADVWGLAFSQDLQKIALGRTQKDKNNKVRGRKIEIIDLSSDKVLRSRWIKFEQFSGLRWNSIVDQFLTFVSQEDGDKIGLFSWDDTKLKLLGSEGLNISDARWSPNGERIGFVSDHSGSSELYIISANGGKEQPITANIGYISSFSWLPSSDGFLVVANKGGDDGLYRLQAPYYKPEKLSEGHFYRVVSPLMSPDGERVAFMAYSSDFYFNNLYIMDVKSGEYQQLTKGASVVFLRWEKESTSILFGVQSEKQMDILRYPLDKSGEPEFFNRYEIDA